MTNVIELAKKCGFPRKEWDAIIDFIYEHGTAAEGLDTLAQAFYDAAQKEQMEKCESEFIALLDAMIASTKQHFTDHHIPVQQLEGVKNQIEIGARFRKFFPEQPTGETK